MSCLLVFTLCLLSGVLADVTLYYGPYFDGDELTFNDPYPDLRDDWFNNKASSVLITGLCPWELCTGLDYRGKCVRVMPGWYDGPKLKYLMGGDNVISSVNRVHGITLFAEDDHKGRPVMMFPVDGDYKIGDLDDINFDNTVKSIKTHGHAGGTWEVCTKPWYKGRCMTFTKSVMHDDIQEKLGCQGISSVRLISKKRDC